MMFSLEEATIDDIRDLVDGEPAVRAEIYHAAHKSLELRSPEHRGYHFRVLGRTFAIKTVKVGRKLHRGVYEIQTEGAIPTRPKDDEEGRGYRYDEGTVAYLTRHRLLSFSQLHEAIATPPRDRLPAGQLADRLASGTRQEVLEAPRTLQLASLHQACRETLGYSRAVYAQIIGARTQHTVKNWEVTKSRVPAAVWPKLIELLNVSNRMAGDTSHMSDEEIRIAYRRREMIKRIELDALGMDPRPKISIAPVSTAKRPLTPEEVRDRSPDYRYGIPEPYWRRAQEENREKTVSGEAGVAESASSGTMTPEDDGDDVTIP